MEFDGNLRVNDESGKSEHGTWVKPARETQYPRKEKYEYANKSEVGFVIAT